MKKPWGTGRNNLNMPNIIYVPQGPTLVLHDQKYKT